MIEKLLLKLRSLHVYEFLLYLCILSIYLVFGFLLFIPLFREGEYLIPYHNIFLITTLLAMSCSAILHPLPRLFDADAIGEIHDKLKTAFIFSNAFSILQIIACINIYETSEQHHSMYIYLIAGLHLLHIFGGIAFLTYNMFYLIRPLKDPVQGLIFLSNKYQRLKLKLIVDYWHAIDLLWVIIFFWSIAQQ